MSKKVFVLRAGPQSLPIPSRLCRPLVAPSCHPLDLRPAETARGYWGGKAETCQTFDTNRLNDSRR